jgi:hypothetical protein
MKTVFLALLTVSFLALHAGEAQAHDLRYDFYEPHLQYPQPYDPYYELHLIHYQLYRQQFYPRYPVYPVQVFVIRGQPKQIRPPQESRK